MPLDSRLSKMNIRERLEVLQDLYSTSKDVAELTEAYMYLLGMLKKNQQEKGLYLSERNCAVATELLYNTRVKGLLLKYFNNGYMQEDGEALLSYIQAKIPNAEANGFLETKARFVALAAFLEKVIKAMVDITVYLGQVQDDDGNLCTMEIEQLQQAIMNIQAVEDSITSDPFSGMDALGENVELFNLKANIKKDIAIEVESLKKALGNVQDAEAKRLLDNMSTPFSEVYSGGECEFFPVLPLRKETRANCLFLCSPFLREVHLYVKSFADDNNRDFVVIEPNQFNGKSVSTIRSIFQLLEQQGKDCLINDINEYRNSENLDDFLREMIAFGKRGHYIFIIDSIGKRKFYNMAFEIAKTDENLSIMDVSYAYLTMPAYSDTIELFEDKGMITAAEYSDVRQNMPFMGFCGLNDAVAMFAKKKDWKKTAMRWSTDNKPIALEYLANLPLQVNLIDSGWGDYSELTLTVEEKKRNFDYDDLAGINTANLRKIVDGPYNLFEKCGCVTAYCLLAGADSEVWKTLDASIQSERLTLATRLVMRLLDVDIEPEVKVVPKEEWTLKGAGGVCCDGGKRIEYRQDCITNYDWMVGTVVHECFHAFQHKAEREWKRWYFDELGVTKGRVNEWAYNNGYDTQAKKYRYYSIDKNKTAYMVQIIESDARAFEIDCENARAKVFPTIKFD